MSGKFTPPYFFVGLYDHEELMRLPDFDSHVREYRQVEREKADAYMAEQYHAIARNTPHMVFDASGIKSGEMVPVYGVPDDMRLSDLANGTATGAMILAEQYRENTARLAIAREHGLTFSAAARFLI